MGITQGTRLALTASEFTPERTSPQTAGVCWEAGSGVGGWERCWEAGSAAGCSPWFHSSAAPALLSLAEGGSAFPAAPPALRLPAPSPP